MMTQLYDRLIAGICRALCVVFFWRFRVIPRARQPEVPLLRQLLIWKSKRLEIYLQHFDNPEEEFFFHCHEWPRMRSFVLSSQFTEERAFRGDVTHKRFTTYTMDQDVWHRTAAWGDDCWTLFICRGGRTVARGYREKMVDGPENAFLGPFIPWRDHIVKKIASLTGYRTP